MKSVVNLPKIETLECDANGNVDPVKLADYYSSVSRIPARLRAATNGMQNLECALKIELAASAVEKLIKSTNSSVTEPFVDVKSTELETRYQVREILNEMELSLKKKIVDELIKILGVLGIPNPFTTPIPFLGSIDDTDENGKPVKYQPVIADLFTKTGQAKIKKALQNDKQANKKAQDATGKEAFNGDMGVKSPDLEAEETWHGVKNWFNKLINDFLTTVLESIAKALKKIPIVGQTIYDAVFASVDPTIAIEKAHEEKTKKTKEEIKKERDAALKEKRTSFADDIMNEFIKEMLEIKIPFIGKVGDLVSVDKNKKDIVIPEEDFHKTDDATKESIQKSRRIFKGQLFQKIYDIILKAPSIILTQFPIVGTIFKTLEAVVKLTAGQDPLTECDRLNLIAPKVFLMTTAINTLLPDCVDVVYVE
jgi:hypothetical protein